MKDAYRRLWILLRERLTEKENKTEAYNSDKEELHNVLTMMAKMEACEFLED